MKDEIIKNFKCSAPWEGLFINPDGDVRVCCAGKSLGNLNKTTLADILSKGELKQLQKDISEQGHSTYCQACMNMEKVQGRSLRDGYDKDLSNVDTAKFKPAILDIRWRNACQLRCLYCNSSWSSTFAQWEGKTTRASERNWQPEVLDYIQKNKPEKFKHVYMLGGEPFILKENELLLDMVDHGENVGLVTNLSIPDMHTLPLYEKILSKNCSILVSLENIGNKFEYARRNACWEKTEQNYKRLLVKKPGILGCHMTYNLLSAFTLVETFDWIRSMHPEKEDNRTLLTILLDPRKFLVTDFPKEIKQLAIDEFDRLEEKHHDWLSDVQKQFITFQRQALIDSMDICIADSVFDLVKYVKKTDVGMGTITFANEWPEINKIIEKFLTGYTNELD